MIRVTSRSYLIKIALACGASLSLLLTIILLILDFTEDTSVNINWDADYTESASDYKKYNASYVNWEAYIPSESDVYTTVEVDPTYVYTASEIFESQASSMTLNDEELIMLSENEAWSLISNGRFNSYPTQPYKTIKNEVAAIQADNTETIKVKVWYWANPKDDTDMSKVTVTKTFAVNSAVAVLFEHAFEDIYNDPSCPIINIADGGMGTWVLRGKNHNDNNTLSAHALGTAIDINPSTGSFYVNGTWYGNAYKQKAMPANIWAQLPECHKKYHVLYEDCPIVSIFKSYGFYWGGDWSTGTDCMHLAFIGDGSSARKTGQSNYLRYN